MKRPNFLIAGVLWLLVLAGPTAVRAQTATPSAAPQAVIQPMNLTISPITLSLETRPGEPVQSVVRVRNNGLETEYLRTRLGTFLADATGQRARLIDPKPEDTYMEWLHVNETEFTLYPGEWKTLTLTFAPPSDAALSYYYTLYFERQATPVLPGAAAIQGSPALLILTTVVSPQAKRELVVEEFRAAWPIVEFLPQHFSVRVKNSGNVHVVPTGNIFIDGQGKKDLAVLSINPSASATLPQTTREYAVEWRDGFPVLMRDEGEAVEGIHLGASVWNIAHADRFRVGKYTAHLLLVYDNGERDVPTEAFVTFWVIPWRLLILVLTLCAFTGLGVWSAARSIYRAVRRP